MPDNPRLTAMSNLVIKLVNQVLESDVAVILLQEENQLLKAKLEGSMNDASKTSDTKH